MTSLRILLVDDHAIFTDGLAAVLENEPDLTVVGTAQDGRAAVKAALELEPDVVVMDISMPGLSGIEATRQIVGERPALRVLCLTMHRDRAYLQAALESGAIGYMLKDGNFEELAAAIRSVAGGETYLCSEMMSAAVEDYRASLVSQKPSVASVLTAREREILQLIAEGWTSQRIADRLFISERTVSTHRRHLAEKLDIRSVAGLTKYAIRHGLTTAERDRRDTP